MLIHICRGRLTRRMMQRIRTSAGFKAAIDALTDKIRPTQVLVRNCGDGQGPRNIEGRVIMANAAGGLESIGLGNQVIDYDVVAKGLEAVRKPLRNIELSFVGA